MTTSVYFYLDTDSDVYEELLPVLEETESLDFIYRFSIEDVSVNFIYAQDDSKYFTYNSETGNPEGNFIVDPLVEIYDQKVDDSWLGAWMTTSVYFYLDTDSDVYEELLPVLEETESLDFIYRFEPVYDQLGERIYEFQKGLQSINTNIILIFALSIFMVFCAIYFLYERKQKRLSIHMLFGYSFFSLCKNEFLWICVPTWFLVVVLRLFFPRLDFILYSFWYALIEIFMVWLILRYFLTRNVKEAIGKERK
ncbi:hypothetical protein FACS189418_9200 [Clostridia bacterium]|nr:hypothetical protein FACS189418_9200 [Clostridia bacterium]